jgi:hypothetical protein
MGASGWKIALFCLAGGFCFTAPALGAGHFWWWWLAGIITSLALLPVVRCGPRSAWAQFASIAAVLVIVGLVCTISEAALFYPETKATLVRSLIGGTVLYMLAAAALTLLARGLNLSSPSEHRAQFRSAPLAIPMVLLSGLSYVVYYLVFGAIAFQFFTRKFYPHAAEQVAALGNWFWAYQWGRGLLMTVAVLPVIYALRMPRWKAALVVGLLIWIVGGGAPLLVPSAQMVPEQRYMHVVEIMTQNVSLGLTAVWLLRRKTTRNAIPVEHPVTA